VLSFADLRHWSERTAVMLCMQTTDTSLDLYWHHGRLRSRQGSGTPPSVHIPVAEEFADQGAILTEVINRTADRQPHPGSAGLRGVECRSIIDAHGGRLWAEPNKPRGVVFQFILPDAERELTNPLQSGHRT
jgi:hypothetical protein